MIPNENIYAKPMTLYIHDYPLFTIPFAIFPNKMGERISGWIMPSFGNNKKGTYIVLWKPCSITVPEDCNFCNTCNAYIFVFFIFSFFRAI